MDEQQKLEWLKCSHSPIYWINEYVHIYDATLREWIPFRLWKEQAVTLKQIVNNLLVIILKARQLGLTWLVLAFALWLMLFHPAATVLIFSRRDDEAVYLLGTERLKGMYNRLPDWQKAKAVEVDSGHEWRLSNGSVARAFPTSAGDSYTASLAIVDEADLVPDLGNLMNAVKPTIDGGGRMILLSRADNTRPESEFKQIYRAARNGQNTWCSVFLPWHVRPDRDQDWYERQSRDSLANTGSLDDLHQQYPATEAEALSPRTLDKRISPEWILSIYQEMKPIADPDAPAIPGLETYAKPVKGRQYVIGIDPAEGNPTSDDSALTVMDVQTGEEVGALAGKYQPSTIGAHADKIGQYYNQAAIMVERNNHGHAVLLWLRDNSALRILVGRDGKQGWHSTSLGKALLYDAAADACRDKEVILHSFETYAQLSSIEGSTLLAPEGQRDDRSDSYALANIGRPQVLRQQRKAKQHQGY